MTTVGFMEMPSDLVPVAKPEISGGAAFYRVKVSATPAASTND